MSEFGSAWPRIEVPQGFKGHVWETIDGSVDLFATSGGYCNGPRCVNCGLSFCMHCVPPSEVEACGKNPMPGAPILSVSVETGEPTNGH